jgi:hypothetical protein
MDIPYKFRNEQIKELMKDHHLAEHKGVANNRWLSKEETEKVVRRILGLPEKN